MTTMATEPRARFRDLVTAEWIKLWSLRSAQWIFGLSALAIVAINANAARADIANWLNYSDGIRANFVPMWSIRDAFVEVAGLVLILVAGSVGAMTVAGEYSSGLIRTTFAAVPDRRAVVAAKVVVVTAVFTVYGALVSGFSFGVTQAILASRDAGLSIGYPGALRAVAASALLAPVCAVIGMGIGALVRHTAATIATTVGVLILLPRFFETRKPGLIADIYNVMPFSAWDRLTGLGPDLAVIEPTLASIRGSWLVYAIWPLVAAAAAILAATHRDV